MEITVMYQQETITNADDIRLTLDPRVRETAESVSGTLGGSYIFYSPDGAGAIVVQYNATEDGSTYIVDIDGDGSVSSGMTEMETGFEA
jgi:hypothetical protein